MGREFFVVCLQGQADADLAQDLPHIWLPLGAGSAIAHAVLRMGAKTLVLVDIDPASFRLLPSVKVSAPANFRTTSRPARDAVTLVMLVVPVMLNTRPSDGRVTVVAEATDGIPAPHELSCWR